MSGPPMSPEEMAAFNARFGIDPAGPRLPIDARLSAEAMQSTPGAMGLALPESLGGSGLPPPRPEPMTPALPADARLRSAALQAMPEAMALKMPAGLAPPDRPQLDMTPLGPWAPKPNGLPAPQLTNPAGPTQAGGPMQPSYPPAHFVPGQWVGKSRVIDGGHEIANADKLAVGMGQTMRGDAADVAGTAQQQMHTDSAGLIQAAVDQNNDLLAAQKSAEARRQAASQQAQARYQTVVDDAAKQADVNPDRFFANRGMGAQLLAVIGVALGQASASLRGGPNVAAQMIDSAIDRDLQAQRDNIAKAQGNVSAAKGVLGEMRQQFGDERQAELAAKDAMLAHTELQLRKLGEVTKGEEARAKILDTLGQIQEQRGQNGIQWGVIEQGKIKTAEVYAPGHTVGGAPAGGAAPEAPDDGRNVTAPDGTVYRMPSGKEGAEMRKRVAYVQEMHKIADRVDSLRGKAGSYFGTSEGAAELQTLKTDYMLAYQHAHGIQRLTDKDIEVIDHAIGDPNALTSRSGQRFKMAADNAEHGVDLALKSAGARVVNSGYGRDAAGNVKPTETYAARDVASANAPPGFRSVDGTEPRRFKAPASKAFDPNKVQVELKKRKGAKGGGKASPQADDSYVSPADDEEDQ